MTEELSTAGENFDPSEGYENKVLTTEEALNDLMLMVATMFVFMMQLGFALLESGMVSPKNSKQILIKNVFDAGTTALSFWLLGFGFAFGVQKDGNQFIGTDKRLFASKDFLSQEENVYLQWMWQFTFAATSATIVSGSIAERTQLLTYLCFSALMTGFIYPIVVAWTWGGGWLG